MGSARTELTRRAAGRTGKRCSAWRSFAGGALGQRAGGAARSRPAARSEVSSAATSAWRHLLEHPADGESDAVLEHLTILAAQVGMERQQLEDRVPRLVADEVDRPRGGQERPRQMLLDGVGGAAPAGAVAWRRMAQQGRVRRLHQRR
jgi:hypothetical protein